jgi:Type II secretion system (T2SS), protein E, N-terminal domain
MAKLGQLLVARGWITVQQLTRALKNQNVAGGRLGTCLLEMDALTEELLLKGLSEQLGVPAADADELRGVPEEVLALVPEKLARRCRAVPFHVEGGRLDLALMDPRNLSAQDEIAFASGKRVKVFVAEEIRILEAIEKYYHEECPSRFGLVLDRLNRARFLWEKPADKAPPHSGEELLAPIDHPFAPPPKLDLPPDLPPPPVPRPVPPVDPALFSAAVLLPPKPFPEQPAPSSPTPMRSQSVSLTPEERAELGAFSYVEPAADRSLPAPANLEAEEEELAKANDLEEVARLVLGFLGRDHRRAAIFQVSRERVTGWRVHGMGIDRDAFMAFSIGFDQPSLFLNLRHNSGIYFGPLPPMPAHRQLARTWGGDLPRDCVLLPVRIKDRLVLVIYADGATRGPIDLSQMQRLAAAATSAVERCILQKKAKAQ